MAVEKKYDPHVVIVWPNSSNEVAVQEFPYKEDAEAKYEEIVALHFKVVLAKVVRAHGEG